MALPFETSHDLHAVFLSRGRAGRASIGGNLSRRSVAYKILVSRPTQSQASQDPALSLGRLIRESGELWLDKAKAINAGHGA